MVREQPVPGTVPRPPRPFLSVSGGECAMSEGAPRGTGLVHVIRDPIGTKLTTVLCFELLRPNTVIVKPREGAGGLRIFRTFTRRHPTLHLLQG